MVFNEEVFLEHKSSSMRQFLQSAVHLQFFKQVNLRASRELLPSAGQIHDYNFVDALLADDHSRS